MRETLQDIAQQLKDVNKKVQLIYAFNGIGKTRLSREFRLLVDPKDSGEEIEEDESSGVKVVYYNAFTEDLFYWDNDLSDDTDRKLRIHPNTFTNWVLAEQGQEPNIIAKFQHYTNDKLSPRFNEAYSEVMFSIERGDDDSIENVKISKGEESNFIWCVFYSLLESIVEELNKPEVDDRSTDKFNDLRYVFIDDPVSSLDDSHLIELAVNIATLIKSSQSELQFIITTHNPLFYNVLFNEFNNRNVDYGYNPRAMFKKYRLERHEDNTFSLVFQPGGSPFSYHLYLISILEEAIESGDIRKYHFNFLRNILEKTSTFLGYQYWSDLLPDERPGERKGYMKRILNLSSHSEHSGEEASFIEQSDKLVLGHLVRTISEKYHFKSISSETS